MDLRLVAEVVEAVVGSNDDPDPDDDDSVSKGEVVFLFVALGVVAVLALGFMLAVTDYSVMEIGEQVWTMAADSCTLLPVVFVALAILAQYWVVRWIWRKITGVASTGVQKAVDDLKK